MNGKSQIGCNALVVGDFNIPLSPIDRSSRKKFNKEILEKNDTIDLMDLADVCRVFHPKTAQFTFSQQPMELSSK
jgi:exonuclease III